MFHLTKYQRDHTCRKRTCLLPVVLHVMSHRNSWPYCSAPFSDDPLFLLSQGPQWSVLSCAAVPNIQKSTLNWKLGRVWTCHNKCNTCLLHILLNINWMILTNQIALYNITYCIVNNNSNLWPQKWKKLYQMLCYTEVVFRLTWIRWTRDFFFALACCRLESMSWFKQQK